MEILDSGKRREFESGAVRDVQEGKGRCDLLPLNVVARVINFDDEKSGVLVYIDNYVHTGATEYLFLAIKSFIHDKNWDVYTAVLEVAKHFEDGAKKYDERNWEKGISLHCYIDSGIRHYLKFMRGDTDEPHDRAFIWNMLCAIWTHERIPSLIDLPFAQRNKKRGV